MRSIIETAPNRFLCVGFTISGSLLRLPTLYQFVASDSLKFVGQCETYETSFALSRPLF